MESLLLLLRCLTLAVFVWSGNCKPNSVKSGEFISYMIKRKDYAQSQIANAKVSFNFTTENGSPALPPWLQLEQRTVENNAFIYGTPHLWDKTAEIEIIGWDKNSYLTKRNLKTFDVEQNENDFPWFQVEFMIKNMNLDKFLQKFSVEEEKEKLLNSVKKYWSPSDLMWTHVQSALSRGGRIPLPKTDGSEGVYFRVGSHESWESAKSKFPAGEKPAGQDHFMANGSNYEINWLKFSWLYLRKLPSPEAQLQALFPADKIVSTVYAPRTFDDSPRDFEVAFILVVVIPIVVIVILVLLLSIIMCFGREGRRKRDQETPHIQLTHHHNIQRSTLRLRELSKPGENEQTTSQAPAPVDRDPSRPRIGQGEYERLRGPEDQDDDCIDGRNAPPPYRMPPSAATVGAQQV